MLALCWLLMTSVAAGVPQLTRSETDRALAIARSSDDDRARFHQPYILDVKGTPVEYATADQIEVITEFRRFELAAEDYARRGEMLGPSGVRQIEAAQRPERGAITIVAHVRLNITNQWVTELPAVEISVEGCDGLADVRRTGIYSGNDAGTYLIGEKVERLFDRAIAESPRTVRVLWKDRELARATIDFGVLK